MTELKVGDTWYSASMSQPHHRGAQVWHAFSRDHTSFYLPPTCLSTNGMIHTWFCLPNPSWSSFTDPGGMEGWVGLGTSMVNKHSAQDRYVMEISYWLLRPSRLTGQLEKQQAMSVELKTSCAVSRDANPLCHRVTRECVFLYSLIMQWNLLFVVPHVCFCFEISSNCINNILWMCCTYLSIVMSYSRTHIAHLPTNI